MGEWNLLPCGAPPADALWRRLTHDGHVRVFTQLPQFCAICRDELGWDLQVLVRETTPVVVPLVVRRRRQGLAVLAESLAHGLIGGPISGVPLAASDLRSLSRALQKVALEVLLYPGHGGVAPAGWETMEFVVHEVAIGDGSGRSPPSRSCRSAARHAQRCGVRIATVATESGVEQVAVLHMRQQQSRHARYYPRRWLQRMVKEMPDSVRLWGAYMDERLVAALLIGWWGETATALLSTTDPEARPLNAGNLLYLSVLELLAGYGVKTVDLGGSRNLPALEAFKRSLGGVPACRPYYRYRHPGFALYQRIVCPQRD